MSTDPALSHPLPTSAASETSQAKTVLVVRGGWPGHSPEAATDLFLPFLNDNGYQVDIADSPAPYADAARMAGVDLVLQCVSMSTISDDEVAGLRRAVAAGTGFAGWHGGIVDSYRANADYLHLVGGQFASHPPKPPHEQRPGDPTNAFVDYEVTILPEAADHPIVAGVGDFRLHSEQYWVLRDDYIDVLATTTQAVRPTDPWHRTVTSPAVWTRQWGQGRIFVATPGHDLDVLRHPSVTTIIERGLLWASR